MLNKYREDFNFFKTVAGGQGETPYQTGSLSVLNREFLAG